MQPGVLVFGLSRHEHIEQASGCLSRCSVDCSLCSRVNIHIEHLFVPHNGGVADVSVLGDFSGKVCAGTRFALRIGITVTHKEGSQS